MGNQNDWLALLSAGEDDTSTSNGTGKTNTTAENEANKVYTLEDLEKDRIRITDDIEAPPICIYFHDIRFGTLGNFSCITGKAKSRKSVAVSIAVACSVSDMPVLKFSSNFPEGKKKILYFDTEQGEWDVFNTLKRTYQLAGLNTDTDNENLIVYRLRKYAPHQRIARIKAGLQLHDGIGMVIIDGLRDLVMDINDYEEATQITTLLMDWTETFNIHLVTVLHMNKANEMLRGAIGTEVINKAETVISVEKMEDDPKVSIIKSQYTRDADFPDTPFQVDSDNVPSLCDYEEQSASKKGAWEPGEVPPETHLEMLEVVFSLSPNPTYNELWPKIKRKLEDYNIRLGDNRAKKVLEYYEQQKYVIYTGRNPKVYQLNLAAKEFFAKFKRI